MSKKLIISTLSILLISLSLYSNEIINTKIIKQYRNGVLICNKKHYKSVIVESKSQGFNSKTNLEVNSKVGMKIFPNPVRDKIKILSFIKFDEIDIFNGTGVKVKTINYSEVSSELSIEFNNHPKGLYFINFYLNGNLVRTKAFVK